MGSDFERDLTVAPLSRLMGSLHVPAFLPAFGANELEEQQDPTPILSHETMPRNNRRLSDKILLAFHQACDQHNFPVALELIHILETMVSATSRSRGIDFRKSVNLVVAAHERLWHIRHAEDYGPRDSRTPPSAERKENTSN
jgi:hypothetical protein